MSSKEEVEKLLKVREKLEKKISRYEAEIRYLRYLLSVVNERLSEKSFKVAETLLPQVKPEPQPSPKQVIQLKSGDGILLATMYVEDNEIRVTPSENIRFNVNIPPFQQFFVGKVLNGMISRDRSEAMAGTITPDEILSYRIIEDKDVLKEIIIRNYREQHRITTLKNAIRWTLEKMYEKIKLQEGALEE
ncbi:hypothetical protein DRO30_03000 [Candidatus Bathyarchaeota archaeon]|nr:MAG: hypothetical protein DRO30_03000 [Candidatus Bathyarchaeota archaeon]RLI33167.1 MAG: hypothetical protein DRO51_00040 [Candidatus Bathyarchaeota archaeon]